MKQIEKAQIDMAKDAIETIQIILFRNIATMDNMMQKLKDYKMIISDPR